MAKRPPKPPTTNPRIAQDLFDGAMPGIEWFPGDWPNRPRVFPHAHQDAPLAKARPRLRLIRGGKK